jgi:hypothetical protein
MAGILRTDTIQNSNTSTIITQTNSTTITIGTTGQTVALASGASQSGFGRAGSVNWDTTPKTSSPVTAVSGNGYFINTTAGAITINLPSTPAAGDIVAVADYDGTALTNNITVGRNSSNINGSATDLTINTNYSAVTLVYVDATSGWRSVDTSNISDVQTLPEYVAATGGTVTTCGDFKIHSFTGPGTFTVTNAGNPAGSATVDYLTVAGGGGGGSNGGGGGAGGYRFSNGTASGCYSAGPAPLGASALPVSVQGYPITVGSGGVGGADAANRGGAGNPSTFSTITSTGGGGGGSQNTPVQLGGSGGSGGGGGQSDTCNPFYPGGCSQGIGNTPPTSPPQGNNGGKGSTGGTQGGGGGGGASTTGGDATPNTSPSSTGGTGAAGLASSITGSSVTRGGGGGGTGTAGQGSGGSGGGGAGQAGTGTAGSPNTGGGGGGSQPTASAGGAGGSGIVVIRYKFQ